MQPNQHQIQPIDSLTPFLGGHWWIRARVSDKSDVRTWNKPDSQGKLFSFTLLDESASIRATVFNDAVDVYDPLLVNGQVYYLSGAQVKNANRRFSNVNNDYELVFDRGSDIRPCNAEVPSLPKKRYNFIPVELLKQRAANSMVDVLGVVLSVQEPNTIVQRSTGRELLRRTMKLGDATASVEVTLWNEEAKNWNLPAGTVVALSQLRTGSYNGVTLTFTQQTTVTADPSDVPEAAKLLNWYRSTGGTSVQSLSSAPAPGMGENSKGRKYFEEIMNEGIGRGEKPDYVDARCVPVYIKQDGLWYDACPQCNKKVIIDGASERSRCEKCDTTVVPAQRYIVSLQVTDNVSQEWLTLFNETGTEFFGMTAGELKKKSEVDPRIITKLMQARIYRPVLFRLRVKEEANMGGGQGAEGDRLRMTVVRMTEFMPIANVSEEQRQQLARQLKEECEEMLTCIEAYV